MSKTKSTGLQHKTLSIIGKFFEDIKKLDKSDPSTYQMQLFSRVETFFKDMNRFGKLEFASFLEKHQFDHNDPVQQEKYTDAFNCLVAFIVDKYDESDLLRYFLPKEHSIENKPKLTSDSWRIVYWAKFLTYWLASKLFNVQSFVLQKNKVDLAVSIRIVKKVLHNQDYFDLKNQNRSFNECLDSIVKTFIEKRSPASIHNHSISESFIGNASKRLPGSEIAQSTSVSPPAPVPPPSPPPVSPSAKGSDPRGALLAAIRQGIPLKKFSESKKDPTEPKDENTEDLQEVLRKAINEKFKNANPQDNLPETRENWDTVDSAGATLEVTQDEADAIMKIVNYVLPQGVSEKNTLLLANLVEKAFNIVKNLKSSNSDQIKAGASGLIISGLFSNKVMEEQQDHNYNMAPTRG